MKNENMVTEMKNLIQKLEAASDAYYLNDNPIMSDKEYDDLMDQLERMEQESGIVMSNSPLHKVQGKLLSGLEKIKHSKPMLSANKTKDMVEVGKFIIKNPTVQSWKLDGLTIVCRYEKGEFKQAITRGSGDFGEDVTEAFRHCMNLPLKLSKPVDLETRGECVISWDNFKKINEKLEIPYSHPRNLAAGSVRCLDTNIAKERYLEYKVFELVSINGEHMDVLESFEELKRLGFDVVEHQLVTFDNYREVDEKYFNPEEYDWPVDGTIYKYCSYEYGEQLGMTAHHSLNLLARKWENETYETTLKEIQWQVGKTGVITPIAVFNPVEIEGSTVSKATVHNASILTKLDLRPGDTITVYKANQIIPAIDKNLSEPYHTSSYLELPSHCPICGGTTEVKRDNEAAILVCTNEDCQGKLLGKLSHAVSKNALDIVGLSDSTLEFLIEKKWMSDLRDLFRLKLVASEWAKEPGFGKKSVMKLLEQIEEKRNIRMENFLYAQSIPLIGRTASKDIAKFCNGDIEEFCNIMSSGGARKFTKIDGFGETMYESLVSWMDKHWVEFLALKEEFNFVNETKQSSGKDLSGKVFVITGSLNHFNNRDELKNMLESMNAKVSGSVGAKTFALICNEDAGSSKSKKAKALGVQVWTEDELLAYLGE